MAIHPPYKSPLPPLKCNHLRRRKKRLEKYSRQEYYFLQYQPSPRTLELGTSASLGYFTPTFILQLALF